MKKEIEVKECKKTIKVCRLKNRTIFSVLDFFGNRKKMILMVYYLVFQ